MVFFIANCGAIVRTEAGCRGPGRAAAAALVQVGLEGAQPLVGVGRRRCPRPCRWAARATIDSRVR